MTDVGKMEGDRFQTRHKYDCWNCQYEMNALTKMDGPSAPRDGDTGLCIKCGAPGVVVIEGEYMTLRAPNNDEWVRIVTDEETLMTMLMIKRANDKADNRG